MHRRLSQQTGAEGAQAASQLILMCLVWGFLGGVRIPELGESPSRSSSLSAGRELGGPAQGCSLVASAPEPPTPSVPCT